MQYEIPEFYITDDNRRVEAPTWQARSACYMPMTSAQTGQTGPTLINPGDVFHSDDTPNSEWIPLNRAAALRYEQWMASLPQTGAGLSQAEITEAAYEMRPREGQPEIPHDQWWPMVLRHAAFKKERKSGMVVPQPRAATPYRMGGLGQGPVMPFAPSETGAPLDVGRAPPPNSATPLPENPNAARRARARAPMPNANPTDAPASAVG